MLKRLLVAGATAATAAAAGGFVLARSAFREWGIDPADAARALPGDDLVTAAEAIDTRSIDIDAPPEQVFPWLVQMGYGRGGWYSYDQLDMNHPSVDRIVPELQALSVGDTIPTHPTGGFEVRFLEPDHALVLYADRELMLAQAEAAKAATTVPQSTIEADAPTEAAIAPAIEPTPANLKATGAYLDATLQGDFRASWAFVLEPTGDGQTHLIERFRGTVVPAEDSKPVPAVARTMLGFGVFVMTRRQMLGLKARVEGRPETGFLAQALRRRTVRPTPA